MIFELTLRDGPFEEQTYLYRPDDSAAFQQPTAIPHQPIKGIRLTIGNSRDQLAYDLN